MFSSTVHLFSTFVVKDFGDDGAVLLIESGYLEIMPFCYRRLGYDNKYAERR